MAWHVTRALARCAAAAAPRACAARRAEDRVPGQGQLAMDPMDRALAMKLEIRNIFAMICNDLQLFVMRMARNLWNAPAAAAGWPISAAPQRLAAVAEARER